MRVLVTGATGYVGSRLVPVLVEQGHEVYAATRDVRNVERFDWADDVGVRAFDVEDDELVRAATRDVDAVVYLVHSMESRDFADRDRDAAHRMAAACESNDVARIVYLSGLVPDDGLSEHLSSRLEVEEIFLASGVPTAVLRAAMVVGSGSTSFEILRRLTERVPFTPIPAWMRSSLQPIAIQDVVHLLLRAIEVEPENRHYDVGGDEVVSYPELLALFAEIAGLRRLQVTVPLVPRFVVGTVVAALTGISRSTVGALVESLSHDMVCADDDRALLAAPDHEFLALAEALALSLGATDGGDDDLQAAAPGDPEWAGGVTTIEGGTPVQRPHTALGGLLLGVPTSLALRALPRHLIGAPAGS